MNRSLQRACTTAVTVAALGLVAAGTAAAHVEASSPDAAQGGFGLITFQVPTESATATTVGVTVSFPTTPLDEVRTVPLAGWTPTVTRNGSDAATGVSWKAEAGTSITADEVGEFQVFAGSLPTTATISFDVAQTYSDGSVVRWDDPPNADGSEAENPAPVLALAATGATDDDGNPVAAGGVTASVTPTSSAAPVVAQAPVLATPSDTTARYLGGAGVVLGALALGVAGGIAWRSRRS